MIHARRWLFITFAILASVTGLQVEHACGDDLEPINLVVMDPLSLPLSCACVEGTGQRLYEPLVAYLKKSTGAEINLVYEESLQLAKRRGLKRIDVVIGKRSVVVSDARATKTSFDAVASLSDQKGTTDLTGTVLVNRSGPIGQLSDLAGKKVAIGSGEHDECHRLAKTLFRSRNVGAELVDYGSIESAVYAFADGEVDAVVVSDYLPPLLEGCGKLEKGTTKSIAVTTSCPGVQVFFRSDLAPLIHQKLLTALTAGGSVQPIKRALESRDGFTALSDPIREAANGWPDWRGAGRAGQSSRIPAALGETAKVLWRAKVSGPAMAGVSATDKTVVVADKSADFAKDVFRAFDVETGKPIWTVKHDAPDRMEYTNAPRATPVIVGDHVLLQSAFGKLMCVTLGTGDLIWARDMVKDFGGKVPTWGYSVPPLVEGNRVIIAPGSASASVVALDLGSGETVWKTPGHAPAYSPFIFGEFGGQRQIIGYDSAGLGGWDLVSGRRLWELIPPDNSDFHVGTPVRFRDGILLATENNGMRWYKFDRDGKIVADPAAENLDCAPDTCTPVVTIDGNESRVFCTAYGEMFCVDADRGLQTIWSEMDERFYDHTCLIAGPGRILLWGSECDLLLLDATCDEMKIVSQLRPMNGEHPESMSHPAIVGDRLYLRSQFELLCIELP